MGIQITRREVLNTLVRFKDSLSEREGGQGSFPHERIYTALVNRHTGDIRFAQRVEILHKELPGAFQGRESLADWQEVHLVAEDDAETVHFRLTNAEGNSLTPKGLDPLAIRILFETLDALNQLASFYHAVSGTLPENGLLQNLSGVRIISTPDSIEGAPEWVGHLRRMEAEQKLAGSPPGSYLLRVEDGIIEDAARVFAEVNQMSVKVYVMTFVESPNKISEHLLIQTEWGWTYCRDESDLLSPAYQYHPNLNTLLRSLRNI